MEKIDYRYLRPKKAEALRSWCEADVEVQEEPAIWQGKNATILPLRKDPALQFGRGGVMDENGNFVPESAIPLRVDLGYPVENARYRDEKVVYCGYLIDHWGHFLIEAVTRLWYFLEGDESVDKYVFFLEEHNQREITGNYRIFLELLKIWDKLELITEPTTYREVIVPELGIQCRQSYTPKLVKVFDTVAENVIPRPDWETPKKIFYSRSQFKKGIPYEFGFEATDDFFRKNGYTILYPEKVPLDRMIHYIRNAEVVASLSGSLPHNMLFARNGQKLEIVERLVINDDNQTDVNRLRQLQVTYIDANMPVYSVNFVGPVIVGYTKELAKFAEDNGYLPPEEKYLTEGYRKQCFRNYMKAYEDLYNHRWFMEDWFAQFAESQYEGFQAGMTYFGDYIDRKKPYRWYHYFQLHYWKQFAKRLLMRIKS